METEEGICNQCSSFIWHLPWESTEPIKREGGGNAKLFKEQELRHQKHKLMFLNKKGCGAGVFLRLKENWILSDIFEWSIPPCLLGLKVIPKTYFWLPGFMTFTWPLYFFHLHSGGRIMTASAFAQSEAVKLVKETYESDEDKWSCIIKTSSPCYSSGEDSHRI